LCIFKVVSEQYRAFKLIILLGFLQGKGGGVLAKGMSSRREEERGTSSAGIGS